MLKHSPNRKGMVYGPNGKGIMASMEYTLIMYSPMEKVWFYKILFFQVVIVMVKDKKRCIIKGRMSIKTSFMHYKNYITRTRVKLPVVFEEFDTVYIFWFLFFLSSITVS